MKRLFLFLFLFSAPMFAQTLTVKGNLMTMFGESSANSKACFTLTNGARNPITSTVEVTEVGIVQLTGNQCQTPNGSGLASALIYANDQITRQTGTLYAGAFVGAGKPEMESYPFLLADGTENSNPNVPTTTPPVALSLQSDTTYARLDGGNMPFTGALAEANSGVFNNGQMNDYVSGLLNSCSSTTEFHVGFPGNNATETVVGCATVPNNSTVFQNNTVAGYASTASTSTNVVAGYFQSRALVSNVPIWGANPVVMDGGFAVQMIADENDCNVTNTNTTGACLTVSGAFAGNPASFPAFKIGAPVGGGMWSHGLTSADAATITGVELGAQGKGPSQPSQNVNLVYHDASVVSHVVALQAQANNNLLVNCDVAGCGVGFTGSSSGIQYVKAGATPSSGILTLPSATDTLVGRATTDTLTNKSTSAGALVGTVANGTASMSTTFINSATCGSVTTVSATGVLTTDTIIFNSNASPAGPNGLLVINAWPSTGSVNFAYCNPTAGGITPLANTLNWRVVR